MTDIGTQALGTIMSITVKAATLTAGLLFSIMRQLAKGGHKAGKGLSSAIKRGEVSMKDLQKLQGEMPLSSETMKRSDIKELRKGLHEYGVTFHVHRDKQKDVFHVFFLGKDAEQINIAMKQYLDSDKAAKVKEPFNEKVEEAEKKAAAKNAEAVKEKAHTRNPNRGKEAR